MRHAPMSIGFSANRLSVRFGPLASTGAGGRLAVMPRPRFAPREGLADVHGSRGRRQGAMARRETRTRLDIPSSRPTPPAPLAGTTKLRCTLMPRQRRDAGANTPGDGRRTAVARAGAGTVSRRPIPQRHHGGGCPSPHRLAQPCSGRRARRAADFVGPRLVCVEHMAARTFASPARRTSVATAHIGQIFPLAIGLSRDARPASQCASPSPRGLMKSPGQVAP
jgi:hypothetical protein